MKTVAVVLFPNVMMLDVSGPLEVFALANRYLPPELHYQIVTLAEHEQQIRASNGLMLYAERLLPEVRTPFDLLLVPGGPGAYEREHPGLAQWLREHARQSGRYGAVCTGAFILGEAGLLDGHRVTTHWNYLERLSQRYPHTQVETDQIYLMDRQLVTSGGVTAGIDMALAVVADDHGKDIALEVAKVLLVVRKRQGGQSQFGPLLAAVMRDGSAVARAQAYVVDHIEEAFSVARLADLVAMSPRNFARNFQRETGQTPMAFVQNARIDQARKLLESTDLALKTVACRAGFGSARHLRMVFAERIGLTPAQYRLQFGG